MLNKPTPSCAHVAGITPVTQCLSDAAQRLAEVSDSPRMDAEYLMAHALGISRGTLLTRMHSLTVPPEFESLLCRRLAYEPIPYILSEWEFFSVPIRCAPPTLVPRPETEHLVEVALEFIGDTAARVLDLCTGTGCVAIAVAYNAPKVTAVATDIASQAVALASDNASRLGLGARIVFRQGDLFDALEPADGPFDVITANPPYVEEADWGILSPTIRDYEDRRAVVGGVDGLDVVRGIAENAGIHLRPGGLLAMEIGESQAVAVEALLASHGYESIATAKDLAGIQRIATARKPA